MLRGRDLIVFSDDWGRHPFSCQHLVERLLGDNRVLWINTVGYRSLKFDLYDVARAAAKVRGWFTKPAASVPAHDVPSHANLSVINPVFLPFGRSAAVRTFNARSTARAVLAETRRLGFHDPIVITTLPTTAGIVTRVGGRAVVYYCVDDVTLWPGVHGDLSRVLENQLLRESDLVVATAARLQATRRNGRRPTELLTHGVDVAHFRAACPSGAPRDRKVAYYGLIDERCDLDLLAALPRRLPDTTFSFIGTWRVPPGDLETMPNVELAGAVDYAELPGRLSGAGALILPYLVNELAQSLNPLKLKEYLATGLPIVSTDLPEVRKLDRYVTVVPDAESFAGALDAALNAPLPEDGRWDFLAGETWEAKAEQFSTMIESVLHGG